MNRPNHKSARGRAGLAGVLGLLLALASACGPSSGPAEMPSGHGHIELGSTEPEAGTLAMEVPTDTIEVFEAAEVGGLTLWSSTDPAIAVLDEDEPDLGLYALPAGAPVSLELTAVAAGARFTWGEETIDTPGESIELGVAPFHDHGQWEVVLPEGVHDGEYDLSFRFTTTTPPYAPSRVATVTLLPTEGDHGHDEGE
jgi:hypothetical protein